jgi:flagellar protein FliL
MKSGLWLRMGLAALGLVSIEALASGGGETFKEGVNYLPIKPALVVNYGGPGKVKYIKAEISLRVESAKTAQEVTHHMPLVRDTLIMLISSVTDEQMSNGDGKEKMRVDALAKLNQVLEAAEHPEAAGNDHASSDDHKKEDHKKDEHKKDEHKAEKKDAHGKESGKKKDDKGTHEPEPLISDLLFDNLVVQK